LIAAKYSLCNMVASFMLFDEHDTIIDYSRKMSRKINRKLRVKRKYFFNVIILKIYGGMKK